MRTLLVDDAASLRALVRIALNRDGDFDVVAEAGDGRDAIEKASRWRPDVVLLDLAMPVMDGLEALPRIREVSPSSSIVVFTGFGDPAVLRRAHDAGAAGVIEKGLGPQELCDAIRDIVQGRPPGSDPAHLAAATSGAGEDVAAS